MEKQLYDAAFEGNKKSLVDLLQQDPLLLDRFVTGRHRETPLHVASMLGHSEFVAEVLTRNPELAQELNPRKSSALHLAAAKGFLRIVEMLLQVNPDMCDATDLDGRNPLHVAAMKGHLDVLKVLVDAKPWAARSPMEDGETILHACVRCKQLDALKFLVEGVLSDHDFVNCQNRDGNTILHLAMTTNQKQAISFLKSSKTVDVNCKNKKGFTAQKLLPQTRGKKVLDWLIKKKGKGKSAGDWVEKKREALMIVATVLASVAFQAGVNPPGGVWQEDKFYNQTAGVWEEAKFHNQTVGNWQEDKLYNQIAGLSVLAYKQESAYNEFLISNTTGFIASLSIIMLLVSGLPSKNRFFMWFLMVTLWGAITAMAYAYLSSISALTPYIEFSDTVAIALLVWASLMFLLLIGHTLRMIKRLFGLMIVLILYLGRLVMKLKVVFSAKEGGSLLVETSTRSDVKPETIGSNQV